MAAANKQRGHLGFEIGEERYTFVFSTNALCAIEDEFDLKDITQLEAVLTQSPSLRTVRTLFRLGLIDEHPEMDDRAAGKIMDEVGGLAPSLELIMQAVQNAFPEAAKGGTGDPPKPPRASGRGTGARSR